MTETECYRAIYGELIEYVPHYSFAEVGARSIFGGKSLFQLLKEKGVL